MLIHREKPLEKTWFNQFMITVAIIGVSVLLGLVGQALARTQYAGQWDNVPENVRTWFKGVKAKNGIPCCDIADGHRTLEEWRGSEFWIPNPADIENLTWIQVPPEAVVYDSKNPTGEAVVWYVTQGNNAVYIRCFVPGVGG